MSAACPDCGGFSEVTSGAGGTWIRCVAGHETLVTSRWLWLSALRLKGAVRDRDVLAAMTDDQRTDYRDRMATCRDAHRAVWRETRAAFGLTA